MENAILLAWFLNRTLILPKAILGDSFGWNNFDRLNERHNLLYARCEKNKKSCLKRKYAVTSFDNLIDLSWAKQHVQMIDKNRPDFQWLEDQLDIKIVDHNQSFGSFISGDVLFFKGTIYNPIINNIIIFMLRQIRHVTIGDFLISHPNINSWESTRTA